MILLLLATVVRLYHPETVASVPTSRHTHIEVCGTVTLAKWEADGDRHIRVSDSDNKFIVAEIVPYHPLSPMPKLGQHVCVDGIRRFDNEAGHGWWEVHPVEKWRVAP